MPAHIIMAVNGKVRNSSLVPLLILFNSFRTGPLGPSTARLTGERLARAFELHARVYELARDAKAAGGRAGAMRGRRSRPGNAWTRRDRKLLSARFPVPVQSAVCRWLPQPGGAAIACCAGG